jgi:predicted HAD superfamily Cof-like phosphohydrolase
VRGDEHKHSCILLFWTWLTWNVHTVQETLKGFITASKDIPQLQGDDATLISEQADAFVDVYYYMLNAAAKKGVNVSAMFDIVHGANMAKRDPSTGKFLKRDDGKIIKPAGWQPPDVKAEIVRQMTHGEA